MSTLNKLRDAQVTRCKIVSVCGVDVGLKPLAVDEARPLIKQFADVAGLTADDPRLVDLYVELIAKSAVEPGTTDKALDSVEGRDLIRSLAMQDLFQFGADAAEAAGLAGDKADPTKKN